MRGKTKIGDKTIADTINFIIKNLKHNNDYSSVFKTATKEALNEFKKHLDKKGSDYSKSEFKNIKMRVGIHDRLFVKNVCAIGLSAGFIEPLESNGLLSVHEFLINLVKVMKRGNEDTISQWTGIQHIYV